MTQVLERLAYVLRAETEGLAGDLQGAERQLGKFTDFVARNPLASAGALGAALITVGTQATRMAMEVERGLHRIERAVPGAEGSLGRVRQQLEDISKESPRTQAELARAADQIARMGVESTEGLQKRLAAGVRAADASGDDLVAILGGLDQALDLFGEGSEASEAMLAKLFATAKGRFALDDLFGALQAATPAIREFNLSFDTSVRAIATLLEQGRTAKQAGSELKAYGEMGLEGKRAIEQLAEETVIATSAMEDYEAAVRKARTTEDAMWQTSKNAFAAQMIDLGQTILPMVNAGLSKTLTLLDALSIGTSSRAFAGGADVATAATLGAASRRLGPTVGGARGRLSGAIGNLSRRHKAGEDVLGGVGLEELEGIRSGFDALFADMSDAARRVNMTAYRPLIETLDEAIRKGHAAARAGTGAAGGSLVETPDQIKARQDAAKEAAKAATEARKEWERAAAAMAKTQSGLTDQFNQMMVEATATLVDDLTLTFDRQIATFQAAGLGYIATVIEEMKAAAIDAQRTLEAADERLAAIKSQFSGQDFAQFREAEQLATELRTKAEALPKGSKERLAIEAKIATVLAFQNSLSDEALAKLRELLGLEDERANAGLKFAENILKSVAGALQLAEAFGGGNAELAQMAQSVMQIGQNIKGAFSGEWGFDRISSLMALAGGAAQLLKGAFGKSEAERKRESENRSSERAVDRLAKSLGDLLGANISGGEFSRIQGATEKLFARAGRARGPVQSLTAYSSAADFYEDLGIPFEDVERLAKSLGVTLNGTAESYVEFQRALMNADFAAYLSSFAGQMELLEDRFEVYNTTDASEKFRKTLELLMDPDIGAPALFGLLGGIDLSSATGVDSARSVLQGLFERAAKGELTPDELNGLSPQQFIETVKRLLGFLGVSPEGALGAGSNAGVVSGFRDFTSAQGHQLIDLARAEVGLLTRIVAAIERSTATPFFPPALSFQSPTSASAVSPVHISIGNIVVQMPSEWSGDTALVGAAVAAGAQRGVDEALTARGLLRAQKADGDLSVRRGH